MRVNTRMARASLLGLTTLTVALLTACGGAATPPATPGDDAAKGFCDAMAAVTQGAPAASGAVNDLFDEISNEANYDPSADLTNLNTAGTAVVTEGGAYVEKLTTAQSFAEASAQGDFDAIVEYWELYNIALGEIAASTDDFNDFIDQARPLIESEDTAALTAAQQTAADRISATFAAACSS